MKRWIHTKVRMKWPKQFETSFILDIYNTKMLMSLFHRLLMNFQFSERGKSGKEEGEKSGEALEAMNALKHAKDLIVKMDESLKEEEDILQERAIRLRRQSADAFKLMDDVKQLQK